MTTSNERAYMGQRQLERGAASYSSPLGRISKPKALLLGLWSAVTWTTYILGVFTPLWLVGAVLCYPLARFELWTRRASRYYTMPRMDDGEVVENIPVWRGGWLTWLWGNEEDGVIGAPFWLRQNRGQPLWKTAYRWSALRNSVNNLRFVPGLGVKIKPLKVGFWGNCWDPGLAYNAWRSGEEFRHERLPVFWCFCWQGGYTGLWIIKATTPAGSTKRTHHRLRLGWKILPKDRWGVTDYRAPRAGFGVQATPHRGG